MKPTMLYRIASVLLIVFVIGNIYGLSRFWQAVLNPVRFPVGHRALTYAQVVLGLELFCSLCVLFGAYLAWHLGGLARREAPQAVGTLGWILFAYQLVGVVISWIALSGLVVILSVGISICVGWATWLTRSASRGLAAAK